MNFNKNHFKMRTGGMLMLLFTTLFMAGMLTGCAEHAKSSSFSIDRVCQKHEGDPSRVFEKCQKNLTEEEALMADVDEDDDED